MPTKLKSPGKVAYSLIRFANSEKITSDRRRRLQKTSEAYANAHGMTLDKTGWKETQPGFRGKKAGDPTAEFLQAIDQGLIERESTLLVESLEGVIDRHPRHLLPAMEKFMKHGVSIVTLPDQAKHDSSTVAAHPIDLIVSLVRLGVIQEETEVRRMIARQSMQGNQAHKQPHATK